MRMILRIWSTDRMLRTNLLPFLVTFRIIIPSLNLSYKSTYFSIFQNYQPSFMIRTFSWIRVIKKHMYLRRESKVSLLGVVSIWGDLRLCRQIGGIFVLFCSFWRLFTIKRIKSVKVFPFSFWKIIIFFFHHKDQTPGINMPNGCQAI